MRMHKHSSSLVAPARVDWLFGFCAVLSRSNQTITQTTCYRGGLESRPGWTHCCKPRNTPQTFTPKHSTTNTTLLHRRHHPYTILLD